MGHRDNIYYCVLFQRYFLALFVIAILFVDGIQTVQQDSNHGRLARDVKTTPNGFSNVRRISPRVLHKRLLPVDSTFRLNVAGNHLDEISIELPLDSTKVWLDLRLNWDLIPDGYFESFQRNGTYVVHKPTAMTADLCHYQGKIRGRPTSWAAVSTCNGLSGIVFDGDHLHHLEPLLSHKVNDTATNPLSQWETLHYKHEDYKRNHTCDHGRESSSDNMLPFDPLKLNLDLVSADKILKSSKSNLLVKASSLKKETRSKVKREVKTDTIREPYDWNEKSRYVEMVIVVDNKKYKELGENKKQTIRRTKDISNIVNALYAPLNIFIALVGVVVWTEMDEIKLSVNGDDTLANFLHYRRERLIKDHPHDNAQLLTAVEFENGVVGKAMQGPMCSYKFSGGVNSDYKALPGIVATTIAHELGHNFGLAHDGEECKCPGPGGRCIMSASSRFVIYDGNQQPRNSNRTSHWSSCSLEGLAFAFDHGMDYCLRNKPKRLFEGPVCGNGFTEPGEECDCGHPDFCKNTCCNAETCTLHKNASCGAGSCCDLSTCTVKSGGTQCRAASNVCDLPEFCTGESEYCPDDVFKLNGQQCETPNGQAYCYEGKCRTHTDQCRLLWGPSGNNSDNLCYQKNNNGSRYGNCGYNLLSGTYNACRVEDTKCGLLHCKYYHEKLEFGYEPVATMSSFFVNSQGNIHPCRSVTVDFGTQDVDPGLVPDGAKCGTDKMCVTQKCVSVESIMAPFKCSGGCGSHGVCNSKGHCHCDEGYGGSSCSDSGFGGSQDSGPAVDPYATSIFAKSLYVTFMGFIPLIAIISFYVYYANDNFKKLCIRGKAVARPQHRNNNKPQGNGNVALRTLDISNPTPSSTSASNNNSKVTTPDDFFGKHKGFSLSPLNQSRGQNDSNNVSSHVSEVIKNFNNNTTSSPSALRSATIVRPTNITNNNGNIQSATNSNVYYSPVPTQTINETLVKNHNNEKPSIKSYTNTFLQKGMARVSWAQPVAQPLPTNSPSSEDESGATSDTPFYDNNTDHSSKPRPVSSPDPLNENKQFSDTTITVSVSEDNLKGGNPYNAGSTSNVHEKSRVFSGSHSALSRLAGAFPFVRNSLRSLTSSSDEPSKLASSSTAKPNAGRKNLEISTPILLTDSKMNAKLQNLISNNAPKKEEPKTEDEVDYANTTSNTKKTSKGRYANVPLIDESPVKTVSLPGDKQLPKNIQLERIKPESKQTERKPVLRAHSMIQPNRNSIHNGNPNYNSLRRPRPSVPPPKPPEAPPPPPPVATPTPVTAPKARSESPPPITKPKNILRPPVNASNISSILKFSLKGNRADNSGSSPKGPAPIAKLDIDPQSPTSPPSSNPTTDNIYDEIADAKQESAKVEEKVETLSTGSSESAGGLLSEIIFEIQNRNKDSIYNSVDRRKKKRENMAKLNEKEKMTAVPTVSAVAQQGNETRNPSPKSSPKFRYKPAVPAHPILKSKPTDIPKRNTESPPKVSSPSNTVFSTLGNKKRSSSPLTSTGTPPAYKPTIPLAPVISAAKSITTTVPTSPVSTLATSKPTCAVNGIPKVTSSPSYVAKINYFSNLGGNKCDSPMKPLNSLNSTLSDPKKSVVSNIYAPSTVVPPEPTHLSTIRPTYARPYMNNKLPDDVGDENDVGPRTAGIYSPNSNSDYGTLGKNKGKKIDEKPPEVKSPPQQQPQQQGYKSFNPYLNRPLTFSTFRPTASPPSSAASTSSGSVAGTSSNNFVPATTRLTGTSANSGTLPVSSTKASLSMSNPKPVTVSVCSVAKKPFGMDHVRDSVGVTSPLGVMRSPTRVVQ